MFELFGLVSILAILSLVGFYGAMPLLVGITVADIALGIYCDVRYDTDAKKYRVDWASAGGTLAMLAYVWGLAAYARGWWSFGALTAAWQSVWQILRPLLIR